MFVSTVCCQVSKKTIIKSYLQHGSGLLVIQRMPLDALPYFSHCLLVHRPVLVLPDKNAKPRVHPSIFPFPWDPLSNLLSRLPKLLTSLRCPPPYEREGKLGWGKGNCHSSVCWEKKVHIVLHCPWFHHVLSFNFFRSSLAGHLLRDLLFP